MTVGSVSGKSILVTGGGSGIGRGIAASLVAGGADVTILGRNRERLDATVSEIDGAGSVHAVAADITDEEQVAAAVSEVVERAGRLDGVVACAGGSETIGPVTQIDSAAWRNTVDLNVNGTMYTIKHAARELVRAGGGSIVAISSIASSNTHRWFGAYGVTKSAVDHLVRLAADELGASNVRVNGIRPGLTRTELVALVLDSPELSADYAAATPLPRVGEVDDIAALATFLLGDASTWITGQVVNVDGGQMLRRGPDYSSMLEPLFGEDGLRGVVAP
ncbi:SDR family oxidoreductase [Williamsia serinedens]|uniref:NAD(P)-dependent dehydrogenase, short-chain alcohol dehydrogenase family n=1 Tax=Williamsia serinedens TaxID=391736 RepID=A0ABT1H398_9NOCA|nr:SDR family oxidoreductase [Williamsia serinedens]MCP2161125.1 NAD(P)-dependent dehydrogenase, short-chain alcohol dehydrogenase family [Williamsia serinedens]